MDAPRQIAKLGERLRQLLLCGREQAGSGLGVVAHSRLREMEGDRERDQPLLCAVVEVALDSLASSVRRLDDPHP